MKVKDLRIGNLVLGGFEDDEENSNHSVCVVTGLSEDQHLGEGWNFMLENMERKDVENYFEMKPIELTEEWIIKLGFEKNRDYKHPFAPIYFIVIRNEWICFLHNCTHRRIKYVHQLQNLFHSITGGEELELK